MCTTSASTVRAPDGAGGAGPAASEQALARQELCRFLAGCFYEPGPEFVEARLFDAICAAAQRVDPALAEAADRLARDFSCTPLQDLLVDYTRLFQGSPQALVRPYASAWLGGQPEMLPESTQALLGLYAQGGFEMADDFRDLPDHVAVELEFLYLLNHRHNLAHAEGDTPGMQATAKLRQAFLDDHLGRWLDRFCAALAAHAQCSFYRELAGITALFVRQEGQRAAAVSH